MEQIEGLVMDFGGDVVDSAIIEFKENTIIGNITVQINTQEININNLIDKISTLSGIKLLHVSEETFLLY